LVMWDDGDDPQGGAGCGMTRGNLQGGVSRTDRFITGWVGRTVYEGVLGGSRMFGVAIWRWRRKSREDCVDVLRDRLMPSLRRKYKVARSLIRCVI